MQFTTLLSTLAAAGAVAAQDLGTTPLIWPTADSDMASASADASADASASAYVTVVDWFTTVCDEPTTLTWADQYYTATESGQIITITNCPCTITTSADSAATGWAAQPTYVTAGAHKHAAAAVGAVGAAVLALV